MNVASELLTAFWILPPGRSGPLGFGVTAHSLDDALRLIRDAGYGGYNDVKYDLRVDDAKDPFNELARLVNLAYPFAVTNEAYRVLNAGDIPKAKANDLGTNYVVQRLVL